MNTPSFSFIHLSDFHYREKDEADLSKVVKALLHDLSRIRENKSVRPDFVVFSGDLVHAGEEERAFERARDVLISPVMEALGLDLDSFFMAPGNHDISKKDIDPVIESGLKTSLKSYSDVNSLIDSAQQCEHYFRRLEPFKRFLKGLPHRHQIHTGPLFNIHEVEKGGLRIGISCLNSSWRATGERDDDDYGKLLVGERQVDMAVGKCRNSGFRIAVLHHPCEWLSRVESGRVESGLLREFDLVVFGHNHHSSPRLLRYPEAHALVSNGACLYQSPDYFNGYALISVDIEAREAIFSLRTYFERRREFDAALDVAENGEIKYDLPTKKVLRSSHRDSTTISPRVPVLGSPDGPLRIGQNLDGRLEVFAVSKTGKLCHIWQDPSYPEGWSAWASLGGAVTTMEAVRNHDGRLEVFAIWRDSSLYHIWQARTDTGWSDWHSLGAQVTMIRVAQNEDGRLEVFARWPDGSLWHIWQVTGGWSSWEKMGEAISIFEVARNHDGRLEVFSQWDDKTFQHRWQVPGVGWSLWTQLGGHTLGS